MQSREPPRSAKIHRAAANHSTFERQEYALLTEVLDKLKLDDQLRTSIIPDDLMRGTSKAWREIQRDNVPVKIKAYEAAKALKRKLKMFVRNGFRVSEVNLSTGERCVLNPGDALIGDEGISMLAPVLAKCPLEKLDVSGVGLSSKGAFAVALVMSWCPLRTRLVLDFNKVGDAGAIAFGAGLRHCAFLQILSVNGIGISAIGFEAIVEGLTMRKVKDDAFFSLSAKHNLVDYDPVADDNVESFDSVITNLTHDCMYLRHLDLSDNQMVALGEIAEALHDTKHLTSLHLSGNDFNFHNVNRTEKFMHALEMQPKLIELDLSVNAINCAAYQRLAQALPRCTTLALLNLSDTDMSDDEAGAMSDAVAQSPHLTQLNLTWNELSADGVHALRRAWMHGGDGLDLRYQANMP